MTSPNEHETLAKRAEETVHQRFKTACQIVEKTWGAGSAPKCPALVTALVESMGREAQTETFKSLVEAGLRVMDERLCNIASEIEILTPRVEGLYDAIHQISVTIKDSNQTAAEIAAEISAATANIAAALELSNNRQFGVPHFACDRR